LKICINSIIIIIIAYELINIITVISGFFIMSFEKLNSLFFLFRQFSLFFFILFLYFLIFIILYFLYLCN